MGVEQGIQLPCLTKIPQLQFHIASCINSLQRVAKPSELHTVERHTKERYGWPTYKISQQNPYQETVETAGLAQCAAALFQNLRELVFQFGIHFGAVRNNCFGPIQIFTPSPAVPADRRSFAHVSNVGDFIA